MKRGCLPSFYAEGNLFLNFYYLWQSSFFALSNLLGPKSLYILTKLFRLIFIYRISPQSGTLFVFLVLGKLSV